MSCFIANSSSHPPPIHALEEKRRSQKTHTPCYCPIPRRLELPKNGLHTYMALSYFPEKPKPIVSQPLKAQPLPPLACLPDNHTPHPCYYLRRRPQSRRFTPARTPDTITCAIASKRYHGQEKKLRKTPSAPPVFDLPSLPPRPPSSPARRLTRLPRCDSRGSRSICGKNTC